MNDPRPPAGAPDAIRGKFVIGTLVFALVGNLIAYAGRLGWPAATAIALGLNALFLAFIWKTKDELFQRLFFFGFIVGIAELPSDHLAVSIQKTLVYPREGPFIWDSPLYMPLSYIPIMAQIGFLGYWLAKKCGLPAAMVLTGLIGGGSVPVFEYLAKHSNFWVYQNCRMVADTVPYYTFATELAFTLVLPLFVQLMTRGGWLRVALLGVAEGVVIYVASVVTFPVLCQ